MRTLSLTLFCLSTLGIAGAQGPLPYESLPVHARQWSDWVLENSGGEWREGPSTPENFGVRGSAFYAAGLAVRGDEADIPVIVRAVDGVLSHQYYTPGKPWHGTFKRSAREPDPPETGAGAWAHYDPNWREFVGTSLILVRETVGGRLDSALQARIDHSLRLACEGAHARNVRWSYSNIAIMSAYLLAWGGREFEVPEWQDRGDHLAGEIFSEVEKNGTLWEYNSPTYGGVDFFGLGLWRRMPVDEAMKRMGDAMHEALWRDTGRFYHAGLGNLCGPYDRSYGMDMQHYYAITGMVIDLATGTRGAIPELGARAEKSGELAYMPLLAVLDMTPPAEVLPDLRAFEGPRHFSRTIVEGNDARVAHAWLEETWMAGIETNQRGARTSEQYHPITAHWRSEEGELCWLRLIGDVPMLIALAEDAGPVANVTLRFADKDTRLTFEVYAPGAKLEDFGATTWSLPDMTATLRPGSFTQEVREDGATFRVRLTPTRDHAEATLGLGLSAASL